MDRHDNGTAAWRFVYTTALFVIVSLVWGTTWIGIKLAIETIPPLTAAGVRFLLSFPLMLVIAVAMKQPLLFPPGRMKFFVFVTLSYFAIPYSLINYGEQYIAPGLAALIFSAMPIFSLIFSILILHARTNKLQLFGLAIGFIGFFFIFVNEIGTSQSNRALGIAALLAAVMMHGLCYVFTKKFGADVGVVTYNALPIGIAGLLICLIGFATETTSWGAVSATSWAALIYLAFAAVAGFLSYFYLLKLMAPFTASYVYLLFPLVSILIDVGITGKALEPSFILLTLLILAGFAIVKIATPQKT